MNYQIGVGMWKRERSRGGGVPEGARGQKLIEKIKRKTINKGYLDQIQGLVHYY